MLSTPPASDSHIEPKTGARLWTIGTLRYTRGGLIMLFFWLMWNDFSLMLMEAVQPALTGLLMREHGASNTEIAFYLGTFTTVFTIWINPVVSTWSDRTRTRWGRRRPFLLIAAPPAALFLGLIPWAPKAWHWLMSHAWFAQHFGQGSFNGAVLAIAICCIAFGVFNAVLMAIFQYYFWDVVPKSVLGRFNAIAKIVTTVQNFVWNYWLFGLAEDHMEWLYGGLAALCLVAYLASLLMVKEGDYPPPEPRESRSLFSPIRTYFSECYSHSYYWWFFAGSIAYQLGNASVLYRLFHWKETIGLDLGTIGKMQAWPSLAIVIAGYPLGALLDRLGPMRLLAPSLLFWATVNVCAFFLLRGATSLLVCMGLITLSHFAYGVCFNVATVQIFPRDRLGQFCSANAMIHAVFTFAVAPFVGVFFDWVADYTFTYAWSALWQVIAALIFIKVYLNWRARQGPAPADPTSTAAAAASAV